MFISHICIQGLSLHWKSLDQSLAVSAVLIQFIMSFILSSVCSSCHSFVRSFLRSLSRSVVFCQVLCSSFLAGSLSQDDDSLFVSVCRAFLQNSFSFISIDVFFHDLLSTNFVLFLFSTDREQRMMAIQLQKQTDIVLAYKCFLELDIYQMFSFVMRLLLLLLFPFAIASVIFFLAFLRSRLMSWLGFLTLFTDWFDDCPLRMLPTSLTHLAFRALLFPDFVFVFALSTGFSRHFRLFPDLTFPALKLQLIS